MKLVCSDFYFPIEFHENEVITIIMESPKDMKRFATEIMEQLDGGESKWVLSDGGDILRIDRYIDIIVNPFHLELNNRKMITKLYDHIKSIVESSSHLLEWNKICSEVFEFAEAIISETDYQLNYQESLELKDFFKIIDLKFMEEGSLLERIIDYISLMNKVLGIKVFIFFQLKAYMEFEELELLYKQAAYQKINLVLIETSMKQSSLSEKIFLIDTDHCVIYNN